MPEVRAKKALGQHFLTDDSIARRIGETIDKEQLPQGAKEWASLPILEIGPGTGVLTRFLMQKERQLKCVEIDTESVDYLNRVYPQLDVIEGDFLKMDLTAIFNGEFALIGNYPYNISSQIFFQNARLQRAYTRLCRYVAARSGSASLFRPGHKRLWHTVGVASSLVRL